MLQKLIIIFMAVLCMSCSAYADEMMNMDMSHEASPSTPPPVSLHLKLLSKPVANQPLHVTLTFKNMKGKVMKAKDLKVAHTKRVHVMVLDPSLNDYQHIHPTVADENADAIYDFTFTPRRAGHYVIYADITLKNGDHYYLPVWFNVAGEPTPVVVPNDLAPGEIQAHSDVGDFTFDTQATPAIVQVNKDIIINILVKQQGKLYRKLEPTMQSFAHLVGFSENRETVIHVHPLGEEPRSPNQRGGPSLKFHIMFTKPGWYRLFVQLKAEDKDVFVPIDVMVN